MTFKRSLAFYGIFATVYLLQLVLAKLLFHFDFNEVLTTIFAMGYALFIMNETKI